MKKYLVYFFTFLLLLMVMNCKKSSDVNTDNNGNNGDNGNGETELQEQLVGKMYFHDTGPQSQYDIFSADLYIVPIESSAAEVSNVNGHKADLFHISPGRDPMVRPGVRKCYHVEIGGKVKERVVLNTVSTVDISLYNFEIRNLENITNSVSDDFAVNVNNNDWITFVSAPDGLAANRSNTEIFYMDTADRVRHQLTPVNGSYSGNNWDPDWKTDDTIVWSHNGQFVEVNINDLDVSDSIIPEVGSALYDPKYSPDGTMILFNTRQNRKKNSWIKYLQSGQFVHVLPDNYYAVYEDDNPTWVFSNTLLTGHIFMDGHGRIYTRDIGTDDFLIITDGERDFRYVTPLTLEDTVYLIFSDWTDESAIALWISNQNGTYLRELDQTGDEAVFQYLGLPVPESEEDLNEIARQYVDMFEY